MAEYIERSRKTDILEDFVAKRIASLQEGYFSPENHSSAAAKLATLRHAVAREPGAVAEIWSIELEGLPEILTSKSDAPSAVERAIHAALVLYAIHQQSQTAPMHMRGREYGLGQAMRHLVYQKAGQYENLEPGKLPRRFAALVTTEVFDEVVHYTRQLIGQLRHAEIPLDYALLARHLYELQLPGRAETVRLAWGRGFAQYREDDSRSQEQDSPHVDN